MDTNQLLTPHFALREFLHNGSLEGVTVEVIENLRELAKKLEGVREIFGKPIIIVSGFRTPEHNAEVGGARDSMHLYGLAADFQIEGLSPAYVQARLALVKDKIGFCLEITNGSWTHVDCRPVHLVFENMGHGKYKVLSLDEIAWFIKQHGVAA